MPFDKAPPGTDRPTAGKAPYRAEPTLAQATETRPSR